MNSAPFPSMLVFFGDWDWDVIDKLFEPEALREERLF